LYIINSHNNVRRNNITCTDRLASRVKGDLGDVILTFVLFVCFVVPRLVFLLMDTYLIAYDISDAKRLRKVASTCEDFGYRRQFSVFLCRLTALDLVRLRSRLYDIIDLDADQVIFVRLCAHCSEQIEALGRPTEPPDARDVVIVS
jgi:CRISPR-associated protein Cas2